MSTTATSPDMEPDKDASADGDLIALQLQQARTSAGLSVLELSRLTGISKTVLHGYERGRTKPGAREIRVLSNALKVSPNWLIFGSDSFETEHPTFSSLFRKLKVRPGAIMGVAILYMPIVAALMEEDELRSVLTIVSSLIRAKSPETGENMLIVTEELAKALDEITLPDGSFSVPAEQMQEVLALAQAKAQERITALQRSNTDR